jgi:acetyl-CoA acetyltransferase
MSTQTFVAGVGMIPFVKPGKSDPYDVMGARAITLALEDAGIGYEHIQQVYAGYVYGDSTCGQLAAYRVGMTGVPVINVNNNCSTGSSALFLARQAVQSGAVECALAVGFEQMQPGALVSHFNDRPEPLGPFIAAAQQFRPAPGAPMAPHMFGSAGAEYLEKYQPSADIFARVSVKARQHALHNDKAIFRDLVTVEQVLASPVIFGPMTRLQCCPPTCGAAAAVIVSPDFARRHGLKTDIAILGQAMTTDTPSTFGEGSMIKAVGADMTRAAAQKVYAQAGIGPQDVDVCELHDCFTANEVITYEGLGLTAEGTADQFVRDGDNTYGGRVVTNPSGGLLSKGHPLGATGLAQCTELVDQLRGRCGPRQVEGARIALQHNLGLGGACVVTMYGLQ